MSLRRVSFRSAFNQALRQVEGLNVVERLKLRFIIAFVPGAEEAVREFVEEKLSQDDPQTLETVFGGELATIELDNLERLLQILIEYAPQIIAIIMQVIDLFSGE